jgi:hypothetical protein
VRGSERDAAGPEEDTAAGGDARHGAGPDGLERGDGAEAGSGDARSERGARPPTPAEWTGATAEALTGEVVPPATATNGRRAPSQEEADEQASTGAAAGDGSAAQAGQAATLSCPQPAAEYPGPRQAGIPVAASAPAGPAHPPGTPRSGEQLFEAIVAIRKESDEGALERLKELRCLDRRSGRRLKLLDAHIAAQEHFLAGLRGLRERVRLEAEARP